MFSMRAYVLPSMNYFVRYLFAGERKFFIHFNGSILVLFFPEGRKVLGFIAIAFFFLSQKRLKIKDCKKLHKRLRINGRP